MKGKNYEICHGCRQAGHWLGECPTKMVCPICGQGLIRLFEVEKSSSKYLGKLFYSCSRTTCRFFVWEEEVSRSQAKVKNLVEEETDRLSQLLQTCARMSNEEKVEVSSSKAKVKNLVEEETDWLSQLLKTCARISNEEKVEVTVANFCPSERSHTDKGKEKVKD